jgi:hypothetical protein
MTASFAAAGTRTETGCEPRRPLHQLQPRHAEDGQERVEVVIMDGGQDVCIVQWKQL